MGVNMKKRWERGGFGRSRIGMGKRWDVWMKMVKKMDGEEVEVSMRKRW